MQTRSQQVAEGREQPPNRLASISAHLTRFLLLDFGVISTAYLGYLDFDRTEATVRLHKLPSVFSPPFFALTLFPIFLTTQVNSSYKHCISPIPPERWPQSAHPSVDLGPIGARYFTSFLKAVTQELNSRCGSLPSCRTLRKTQPGWYLTTARHLYFVFLSYF